MKINLGILFCLFLPATGLTQVTTTQLWSVSGGGGSCENGEISADKKYVCLGNSIGELRILNFSTGSLVTKLDYKMNYNPSVDKDGEVESSYFSFDGKYVAAGGNGNGIKIWNVGTWTIAKTLPDNFPVDGMAFSPNNRWFVGPDGGSAKVYNQGTWSLVTTVSHSCDVNTVDFTPDSAYLISGACDKRVKITRTSDWTLVRTITCSTSVKSARVSPDGKYIATGNTDGANVWLFSSGAHVKKILPETTDNYIESVEWTADSQYVIVGGPESGRIRWYRVTDWAKVHEVDPFTARCEYMARVDNHLLGAGKDGTARLYSMSTTTPVNPSPTVSLTSPANGSTYRAPASVAMSASASDGNGTVSKVEFMNGSTVIASDTSSPYASTWSNVAAGVYSLSAKATDNGGATTTSSQVSVTVNASSSSSSTGGGGTSTLAAVEDAYVRDGTSASSNFGTATTLQTKTEIVNNTRQTYLKFNVSSVSGTVTSAKLRLFGKASSTSGNTAVHVYGVATDTWTESGLTWNNKPGSTGSSLANKVVASTVYEWHEFNVTSFVQSEKAAGESLVSLQLRHDLTCTPNNDFNSSENSNGPQLVITTQ